MSVEEESEPSQAQVIHCHGCKKELWRLDEPVLSKDQYISSQKYKHPIFCQTGEKAKPKIEIPVYKLPPGYINEYVKPENKLGSGTFGIVYKGKYEGYTVAIKVFKHSSKHYDEEEHDEEIISSVTLSGLKIAPKVYAYGKYSDGGKKITNSFIVMEKYEFSFESDEFYNLPLSERLYAFMKSALELDKLHGMNMAHNDVKPANMMYNLDATRTKIQNVSLIDFGHTREQGLVFIDLNYHGYYPPDIAGEKVKEWTSSPKIDAYQFVYWIVSNIRRGVELVGQQDTYNEFMKVYYDFYRDMEANNVDALVFKDAQVIKDLSYSKRMYTLYKLHLLMTHNLSEDSANRDSMQTIATEVYQLFMYHSDSVKPEDFIVPVVERGVYSRVLARLRENKKETVNLFGENYTAAISAIQLPVGKQMDDFMRREWELSKIGVSPEIKEFGKVFFKEQGTVKGFIVASEHQTLVNRFLLYDTDEILEILYLLSGKLALLHEKNKVHNNITFETLALIENVSNGIQNVFIVNSKENSDIENGKRIDMEQFGFLLWYVLNSVYPYPTDNTDYVTSFTSKQAFTNFAGDYGMLKNYVSRALPNVENNNEKTEIMVRVFRGIFILDTYTSENIYRDLHGMKKYFRFRTKTHAFDLHREKSEGMQVDTQKTPTLKSRQNKRSKTEKDEQQASQQADDMATRKVVVPRRTTRK